MNKASVNKVFRNAGSLTVGKILGDLSTFFLFVVLSRVFGEQGIGQYSFAMAFTGLFLVMADYGLYNYSIKQMSCLEGTLSEYYGKIFLLRLLLALFAFLFLFFILHLVDLSSESQIVFLLLGTYQVIYSLVQGFQAIFVASEKMHIAAILECSLRGMIALAGVIVVVAGGSLILTIAVFPIVSSLHLYLAYSMVVKKFGRLQFSLTLSWLTQVCREAFSYALFGFLRQLSTRMDVIFLGLLINETAAGIYNAAYRLVFFFVVLSYFTGLALFPRASKLYKKSQAELETLYHGALNLNVLIGLPISVGLWLVAPSLIQIIFGESFGESALVLQFLGWLVFIAFLKSVMGVFLTATNQQIKRTKAQWIAVVVNTVGNLLLIPYWGVVGAAIATLFSEVWLVIIFGIKLRPLLGVPKICSRLFIGGIASMSFYLIFMFFPFMSLVIVIPGSIVLYVGILYLFRETREHELEVMIVYLRQFFHKLDLLTGNFLSAK